MKTKSFDQNSIFNRSNHPYNHHRGIPARMTCVDVLEWVREGVLKEYKNLHHNPGFQGGERSVHYVGEESGEEAAMETAGSEDGEVPDDDDDKHKPAATAVCTFVAYKLHKGGNLESLKPLQ